MENEFAGINSDGMTGIKTAADYEKEIYDLNQMLEITRSLCTTLELPTLIESILYTAMAQMRVTGAGIFVLNSVTNNSFRLGNNYQNLDTDQLLDYSISKNSKLIEKMSSESRVYTLQELEEALPDCKDVDILRQLKPTLIVPLLLKNRLNGILVLGERIIPDMTEGGYSDYEKQEILTITSLAAIAVNNAFLVELSSTDMMTHLKFKYYFFNVLSDRLETAREAGSIVSVLMFDIDFFKKVNDTYGHACGDYVLTQVASIIKGSIRGDDMASRYGGEEFTVLLNGASQKDATMVAERIRKNIENFDFVYQMQKLHMTISGGVSTFSMDKNPVDSAEQLVDQADKALYVSKREGRNRITVADSAIIEAVKKAYSENQG
jgi:diguanylate cyclase (GGDEF)-like protein